MTLSKQWIIKCRPPFSLFITLFIFFFFVICKECKKGNCFLNSGTLTNHRQYFREHRQNLKCCSQIGNMLRKFKLKFDKCTLGLMHFGKERFRHMKYILVRKKKLFIWIQKSRRRDSILLPKLSSRVVTRKHHEHMNRGRVWKLHVEESFNSKQKQC